MKKVLLFLSLFCLIFASLVGAQMIQSGNIVMDLQNYTPAQNSEPFLIMSNLLGNPGFETGSLPPWTTDNWTVTSGDYYAGSYCAEDYQNHWLLQSFSPVPVGQINSVTMWARQPSGPAFAAVDFFYSTTDYDEFLIAPADGWTFIDMTSHLRSSGSLETIRIWGYSGPPPELTRVDEVNLDVQGGTPIDGTSWGRVKALYR